MVPPNFAAAHGFAEKRFMPFKSMHHVDPVHNREGVDGTCRQGQERTLACCVAAAKLAMLTGTPGPMVEDTAARMK